MNSDKITSIIESIEILLRELKEEVIIQNDDLVKEHYSLSIYDYDEVFDE